MILDSKQLEEVPEGSRVFEARIAVSGRNGQDAYAYCYEILDQGNVCIIGKKHLRTEGNFARVSVDMVLEIMLAVIKEHGWGKNIIKIHHPLWNHVDCIIRGTIRSWKKDGFNSLYKRRNIRATNQDLWSVLLYLAEFVSIGVIPADTTEQWYKELHDEARKYHRDIFDPDKMLPEELGLPKLSDLIVQQGRLRRKRKTGKDYQKRFRELNKIK